MSQPGSLGGSNIPHYHEDTQFSQSAKNAVGDLRRAVKNGLGNDEKVSAIKSCISNCEIYAEGRSILNDPKFLENQVVKLNSVLSFKENKKIYQEAIECFPMLKVQIYQILDR